MDRFPIVVPKSDLGEPNIVSRQCLYQKLDEPRNQRAANNIDCARPNEAPKKRLGPSLLMKTNSNTGQGKRSTTQSIKGLVFFVNGIV